MRTRVGGGKYRSKAFTALATKARPKRRLVDLGVIEFNSESYNPGLTKRFFEITKDLTESASIVDLWLMDIASVLKEFGYEMKVWETTGRPAPYNSLK